MKNYQNLLQNILTYGEKRPDRTGTGCSSLFGEQLQFDLTQGFPLLTTKYVPFNLVVSELLWFLSGSTNNNDLRSLNGNDKPTIWEEWATPDGDLGPVYGQMWRGFNGVDQLSDLIHNLIHYPYDRRHVISAWNPQVLPIHGLTPQQNVNEGRQALAPCHVLFQMYASADRGLSCHLYQRSADIFLGVPFNIASYALLTHLIAEHTGFYARKLIISFGDVHLYDNHITQAETLLARKPHRQPALAINPEVTNLFRYRPSDIQILYYKHHPAIPAPVAV